MNIQNLKENEIINTYKELCKILEIKETSGNAKVSQLKQLSRLCEYHKEGRKFIINKIYKEELPNDSNNIKEIGRLGEINFNKNGTKMKIIKYIDNKRIIVEFQDEHSYLAKTDYFSFKNGLTKNLYDKTIYNIAYLGEGKYNTKNSRIFYSKWRNMLTRGYDEKLKEKYKTYSNCTVCKEWNNFQNFAKWCNENYYEIENEIMCLDKDILIKGNKIYSPETCIFVPHNINCLFTKTDKSRGVLPIGVNKKGKKSYQTKVSFKSKTVHIGYFNSENEAFNAYKITKEKLIKQLADEYKDKIPQKLYDAMYRWEVEIDD